MTTPLDAALEYASVGWHVFPLAGKVPLTAHGHLEATTDADTIRAWWSATPDANIGVWLRKSGLIAVDMDPRNGGQETLRVVELRYGALPRECHARSGSGGEHFVMRDPGGRPRGKLDYLGYGKGVDVKCNGYILVEPSVTSGAYAWLACDPDDVPAVPAAWLEVLLHPAAGDVTELDIERWAHSSDDTFTTEDAAGLRAALAALPPRQQGQSSTFRAIRTIFHDYGLGLEDGWSYLAEWNERCGAPRDQSDLERAVERAAMVEESGKRGRARKSLPMGELVARAAILPDTIIPAPARAPSALERIFLGAPTTLLPSAPTAPEDTYAHYLQQACIDVERYVGKSFGTDEETPFFEEAWDLFTRAYPPTHWLVDGLIVDGGIVVIGGEPKAGKTWIAAELALALANGLPAFGKYAVPQARAVAYYCTEDLAQSMRNRLRALCRFHGIEPEVGVRNLVVQPRGRMIDLTTPETCARIIASARMVVARKGPLGALVLDPLRNTHSAKENESDGMREVFEAIKMIGTLVGTTMVIPHHMKKPTREAAGSVGNQLRGSNAIRGFLDTGIYLEEGEGGDGRSKFVNAVTGETKAARSAGRFELGLTITDNDRGEAIGAQWTVGHQGEAAATDVETMMWEETAATMCEALLLSEIKRQPIRSKKQLVEMSGVKGRTSEKWIALDIATKRGWVNFPKGRPELTGAGRVMAKDRLGVVPDETPKPPGVLGAFVE